MTVEMVELIVAAVAAFSPAATFVAVIWALNRWGPR